MTFRAGTRGASTVALMLVFCCVALTTACTRDESEAERTPSPTSAPPFATDVEALEAARATYEGFLHATDAIMAEQGTAPDRVDEFATPAVADVEKGGFAELATRGGRMTGRSVVESVALQYYRPFEPDGIGVVSIYACVNVADIDVLDADGDSAVTPDRPDRTAFEAAFDTSADSPTGLRMSSKLVWAGEGVC